MTQRTPEQRKDVLYKVVDGLMKQPTAHLEQQHFTVPEPILCKWCGSDDCIKKGIREGVQEYLCNKCGRKFSNRDNPFGMRTAVDQIGNSLTNYYNGLSLADVAISLKET